MHEWEDYVRYLTSRLFSHRDYFTEEKILSFEEFKKDCRNKIEFHTESELIGE